MCLFFLSTMDAVWDKEFVNLEGKSKLAAHSLFSVEKIYEHEETNKSPSNLNVNANAKSIFRSCKVF